MLTVAVLGPVELRRDGVRLAVPGGKTTELLIRLALDAGKLVRTERLIEDLWSGPARGVARNTLQAKVSRLRRALGDPALLTGGGAGYTLAIAPDCVDALDVLQLASSATLSRAAGDTRAAVRACAAGLALYRGELLPGAGDGEWLTPYRARLEAAQWNLTENHLASRIDLGAAGELVGELEGLVAVYPLREGLWKLLITALYRAGRQADALAAYRRVRQHLDADLGLDPSAELQALEQQILRHDRGLDAPARDAPAPAREVPAAAEPARGNLPGLSASLVGRRADLAAVSQLVGAQRLVTLIGPAGVGKTRLAIETARRVQPAGGTWLVRLENARTSASIWQSIGEAFELSAATEPMVLDRLRGFELLLVVDNCEHLIDTLPELVGRMLTAAPRLRVLATSQLALAMDGEVRYPLEPLTITDSIVLFTQRAVQRRPSFSLDVDTGQIVEAVCRSLDGLPLAIELAAARSKALSVQEIARRLGDRFALLSDPTSRRPPRQRALSAALTWSYDLLFPDDQRGLWALACFPGGAPLAAAEAVLDALNVPAALAIDVVGRLADRSLVNVEVGQGGAVRYRLLDSVREFSIDRLRKSGMADVALGAHASWFADAATRAAAGVRGPDQAEHLALVRAERANIDAALDWAQVHDPLLNLRIVNGFGWAWAILGAGPDTAQRLRAAVTATGGVDVGGVDVGGVAVGGIAVGGIAVGGIAVGGVAAAADRATGLLLAGWLEASGGNLDRATDDLDQAAQLADEELRNVGRLYLSFIRSQQGRARDALELLAACRAGFHHRGREWEEGASWLLSAWAEIALGETARGKVACDQALRLLRPLGDQWALNHAEGMSGGLAQAEHRFADAIAHLQRAADATHQLGFAAAEAHHLANLGRAQEQGGNQQAAIATLQRAISTAHETADLRTGALASVRLGRVLRSVGDRREARVAVESGERWYRAAGGGEGALLAQYLIAALDADDGEPQASEHLADVLATARQANDVEVEVLALDTSARLLAEHGRTADARTMLDDADRLMPSALHLITDHDRTDRDRARSLLG